MLKEHGAEAMKGAKVVFYPVKKKKKNKKDKDSSSAKRGNGRRHRRIIKKAKPMNSRSRPRQPSPSFKENASGAKTRKKEHDSGYGSSDRSGSGQQDSSDSQERDFMLAVQLASTQGRLQDPDEAKATSANTQKTARRRVTAIKSDHKATPFHLVQPNEQPAQNGLFYGQFMGKPALASPFSGPYKLAWTDPEDGLEVQTNSIRGASLEPFMASWTANQILMRDVDLDPGGKLILKCAQVLRAELLSSSVAPAGLPSVFVWTFFSHL
jgi:hypothetical protein